jgi:hypothetical protein
MPFDVTGSGMKYAIESTLGSFVGNVAVTRSTEPDQQQGFVNIFFSSC